MRQIIPSRFGFDPGRQAGLDAEPAVEGALPPVHEGRRNRRVQAQHEDQAHHPDVAPTADEDREEDQVDQPGDEVVAHVRGLVEDLRLAHGRLQHREVDGRDVGAEQQQEADDDENAHLPDLEEREVPGLDDPGNQERHQAEPEQVVDGEESERLEQRRIGRQEEEHGHDGNADDRPDEEEAGDRQRQPAGGDDDFLTEERPRDRRGSERRQSQRDRDPDQAGIASGSSARDGRRGHEGSRWLARLAPRLHSISSRKFGM